MILGKNITFSYGGNYIYKSADFYVDKNQKVGLVGANGAGKSTLYKMITGEEHPDQGVVKIDGKVMLVPQEVKNDPEMDAARDIQNYIDPHNRREEYELLRMLARMELGQFQLNDSPQKMSGGQKTKLAIVRALLAEPEVLLLDEPTNFLDTAGKEWVMNFLGRYQKTLMIISHDLQLLDTKIDKILEVNANTKQIDEYAGNYTDYLKLKGDKEALQIRQRHVQERHIVRMKAGWEKISHVKSEKGVRQKLQLEKRIREMEESLPPMPPEAKKIKLKLPPPTWVGELPVMGMRIGKSYGSKVVLENVDFDIKRGERIALLGPNGAGKSTLIKIIMGMIEPDKGEIVKDEKLRVGYYSQEFETLDMEKSLIDTMKYYCGWPEQNIRSHLGRFLFSGDKVFQKVKTLSGGEKTRMAIGVLLVQDFNLLILDEPTTYLDVLSQRLILEALKSYEGAMLLVSHNPEFVDGLKPSRKFMLPEKKWILG